MSAPVYSVPGQTKKRKKAFWSGEAQIHPLNYLLHHTFWGNVNSYENVHHPVRTANILAIFKTNQ